MGMIALPQRHLVQPQYQPQIDRRGLGAQAQFAVLGGQSQELVHSFPEVGSAGTIEACREGRVFVPAGVFKNWAGVVPSLDPIASGGSFSAFWRGVLRDDTDQILLQVGSSWGWQLRTGNWAPGQLRIGLIRLFQGNGPISGAFGITDGTIHSVGCAYDAVAGTVEFFYDGNSLGSLSYTPDSTPMGSGQKFSINSSSSKPAKALVIYAFEGKLTAKDAKSLHQNPWQIFKAPARRLFTSSGTTAVIGTGSFTEEDDICTAAGTTTILGTGSFTEDNDTVSAQGAVDGSVAGIGSFTEENDTFIAIGTTTVLGSGAFTEDNDTFAATGVVGNEPVIGIGRFTEEDDAVSAAGNVEILAVGIILEEDDIVTASGFLVPRWAGTEPYSGSWTKDSNLSSSWTKQGSLN